MKGHQNTKNKIFHNSMPLSLCSMFFILRAKLSVTGAKFLALSSTLFALCVIFVWILYPRSANSGPYLDSAHGNASYGVLRTSLNTPPNNYSRGNCAHCHEQHASIGGIEPAPAGGSPSKYELFRALFIDQSGMFCYACHQQPIGSGQVSMPYQFNYSLMAGGDTNSCPLSIREAFQFEGISGNSQFNCNSSSGSSHFLADIRTFLRDRNWGFGMVTGDINPCSGCHNPHRAQRDPHTPTGRIVDGTLVSSVSRPSQHTNLIAWELWGDDPTERMNKYYYQPPYRFNSTTTYEPDGYNTSDASRTGDYVTFCLDCHQYQINGTVRDVQAINWGVNGDVHGGAFSQTCCDKGDKKAPYADGVNYVLSCLDCHEPHGSPNEYLLRQEVNGTQVPNFTSHLYYNFCLSCHTNLGSKHIGGIPTPEADIDCWGCHRHGFYNYTEPLGCESCSGVTVKTF